MRSKRPRPARQTAANFWADSDNRGSDELKGNAWMFYQDVHTMIMPWRRAAYSVITAPSDERSGELVRTALRGCVQYEDWDLADFWADFVRTEAARLIAQGCVTHELIHDAAGLHVVPIPAEYLFKTPFATIQVIPKRTAIALKRRWVVLPRRATWTLGLPHGLGTPTSTRWLLRRVAAADALTPDWVMSEWSQSISSPFDFPEFVRQSYVQVARATNEWGWTARSLLRDQMTNYHQILRELMFRRSLARLREHILVETNKLLVRVGVQLQVTGLPTSERISAVIRDVEGGRHTFMQAFHETDLPRQ